MIVYQATKSSFCKDVFDNVIVDKLVEKLREKHIPSTATSHVKSFENSLQYMERVLRDQAIPEDCGVALEYVIPLSSKRIDVLISGKQDSGNPSVVLVELKQWSSAKMTTQDAVVKTFVGGSEREMLHPSYQAWSYAALLEDFNETIRHQSVSLSPCAYLHNYEPDDVLQADHYKEHLEKAPVFLKHDASKLVEFISKFIKKGDKGEVLYLIENGKIKPSKSLADSLSSLMKGNREFVMIDEQKMVYEKALSLLDKKSKQVLIVEGGPGTGKSVVAVNLLVSAINKGCNAQYVTKNSAPRQVYQAKLTGTMKMTKFNNLFKGSGSYTDVPQDFFDMLIVDEAHRLNEKSGMFQNKGENQVKEIIYSSKNSVFFLDEDQKVTFKDIGEVDEIMKWAKRAKAEVHRMELASQFRCNGSDGYLAWLDNTLQIRETANTLLSRKEFDFQVVDTPVELRDIILQKNKQNNKARLVAGYCWDWVSKSDPKAKDIVFKEYDFAMKWNLSEDGMLWIMKPDSVNEIGCIHTCQGLELDYVGVIIGPDMTVKNGKIHTDATKRSSMDASVKGYKNLLAKDPSSAKRRADLIIKNTYKTLMTRGMKGCVVWCVDEGLREWLKSNLGSEML